MNGEAEAGVVAELWRMDNSQLTSLIPSIVIVVLYDHLFFLDNTNCGYNHCSIIAWWQLQVHRATHALCSSAI
jgi:hypothetical protein